MSWCHLDFDISVAPPKQAPFLLSTSLFFMPKYVRTHVQRGSHDETHQKQALFMTCLRFYENLFETNKWFQRNVALRLYFDSSLFMYKAKNGQYPWRDVISRLRSNPHFQLVRFSCQMPEFCREPLKNPDIGSHLHKGLFGTLVRIHAATDFSTGTECVCLIDIDNLYTSKWWSKHVEFVSHPNQKVAVLGFTGLFELVLHGYLPPQESHVPSFLKCGLTSFRRPLDKRVWTELPKLFASMLPTLRLKDAVRNQLFGQGSMGERFYEDMGYGIDEAFLNAVVQHQFSPEQVHIIEMTRSTTAVDNFFERLLLFLKWNGERSSAMQALALAMHLEGPRDVIKAIETQRGRAKSLRDLDKFVKRMRPLLPILQRLQIDSRVLQVIRLYDIDKYPNNQSIDYLVPPTPEQRHKVPHSTSKFSAKGSSFL